MSRVTAPAAKLARSINSAAIQRGVLEVNQGAVLMPKYAELLKKKNARTTTDADAQSRTITTTHRPTPQPILSPSAQRPLMQTFSSLSTSATTNSSAIDATLMPFSFAATSETAAEASQRDLAAMRMPLLPDSFTTKHVVPEAADAPVAAPQINVVAASTPECVMPISPLTEVEGMGVDGVELKFVHGSKSSGGEVFRFPTAP